jgi:hypothetical protein
MREEVPTERMMMVYNGLEAFGVATGSVCCICILMVLSFLRMVCIRVVGVATDDSCVEGSGISYRSFNITVCIALAAVHLS